MKDFPFIILLLFNLSVSSELLAQTVSVGQPGIEESLRNLQLAGVIDPACSFTARPFYYTKRSDRNKIWNLIDSTSDLGLHEKYFAKGHGSFVLLPTVLSTKFNSHHPYGWDDGGMIAAKGLQTSISTGIYASYGPLSIQVQPEYIRSANPGFEYNTAYGAPTTGSYQKLYAGQSSIRLTAGHFSLGLSTENMWWGPGIYSSLLMSNNAPGFIHLTFNTTRPVKTPIGSFEWQLIAGKLDEDTSQLFENFNLKLEALKNDWRYVNGLVLTYQPKWTPGLFLGMTRAFQLYGDDFKLQTPTLFGKYLPVFSALFKDNTNNEDTKNRDQYISLFTRWLFPKSHTEFYFEYGWNDHSYNSRDFVLDPEHSAAYLAGFKKLHPLRKPKQFLEITGEITQMAQSPDYLVRNAGEWYVHGQVSQGWTNENQILGAGSGLGNNVQMLTVSLLDGLKKAGIKLQRIQHQPVLVDGGLPLATLGLAEYRWTDFAVGLLGQWRYKRLLANAELQFVNSKHYVWATDSKFNFYGLLNLMYLW